MKSCAFIYNPESGKVKSQKNIEQVIKMFNQYDYSVKCFPTKYREHAVKLAASVKNVDLILSCGGDGTLNEIVRGNLKRNKTVLMAHLPAGTTNDVGHMYGYTNNWYTNLQLLLTGTKKNIDVCMINKRPFVYVACIGNYVDVAYNTPRDLKKKYGKLGYVIKALNELKGELKLYKATYKVNNEVVTDEFSFIFISNTSRIGGINNIYDDVKLDDNEFEVIFCNLKNKAELASVIPQILTTKIKNLKGVKYYRTDKLEIEFEKSPKISWCIDGEEMKHRKKKFVFSVNKRINMLLPKKNIVKLFKNIENELTKN